MQLAVTPEREKRKIVAIIVTYNGMKWARNCFDSLRNSTIPLQIIVVDNKSSDGTALFIKENYPEVYLVENKENLGFGAANNIGLEYAIKQEADYIYLLNQDAWIKPETVEKLVLAMDTSPEFGIVSPLHLSGDEKKIDYNQVYHIAPQNCPTLVQDSVLHDNVCDKIYEIAFVNAAHWLISAKCLNDVGGFSPLFFLYGEDDDYINRAKFFGYKIGIYPKTYAIHDRKLEDRNKGVTFSKKSLMEKSYHKHILANICAPFSYCFREVLIDSFSKTMRSLLFLKLQDYILHCVVLFKTIIILPSISKYRKASRKRHAYLDLQKDK